MKHITREAIGVDIKEFNVEKYIEVCQWWNGEGFDVSISFNHDTKIYSFGHEEYDAINAIVQYMRSGIKEA